MGLQPGSCRRALIQQLCVSVAESESGRAPTVDPSYSRTRSRWLRLGAPAAPDNHRLPLLPSGSGGFTGCRRAGPGPQHRAPRVGALTNRPRVGIQPRSSGSRVQGTASSPPSTTTPEYTRIVQSPESWRRGRDSQRTARGNLPPSVSGTESSFKAADRPPKFAIIHPRCYTGLKSFRSGRPVRDHLPTRFGPPVIQVPKPRPRPPAIWGLGRPEPPVEPYGRSYWCTTATGCPSSVS